MAFGASQQNSPSPPPEAWGLTRVHDRLHFAGQDLTALANRYGTPLYVGSADVLCRRTGQLSNAFGSYPADTMICFSYKTNPVAGVLRVLLGAGAGAEVVSGYEMWLARRLGVPPDRTVMNGPRKTSEELVAAITTNIGLIVVDSPQELAQVERLAEQAGCIANIALRICPDVLPKGMNPSSGTGSLRSQFGFTLGSKSLATAIRQAARSPVLHLRGTHAHIGSGVHDLRAFRKAVQRLLWAQSLLFEAGASPDLIDVGGGLGTRLSREFTAREMLMYFAAGRLPQFRPLAHDFFARYAEAVMEAVEESCQEFRLPLPKLVLEPGRALVSDGILLLLSVMDIRQRPGTTAVAITDGGALTVSMMFLSELHAVLLANRNAPVNGATHVYGRLPSPMDVVYRNLPLPQLSEGDILAVMDAGAYFVSTATNFGGPRPAVVMVGSDGLVSVVRRRETYEDLARVDDAVLGGS